MCSSLGVVWSHYFCCSRICWIVFSLCYQHLSSSGWFAEFKGFNKCYLNLERCEIPSQALSSTCVLVFQTLLHLQQMNPDSSENMSWYLSFLGIYLSWEFLSPTLKTVFIPGRSKEMISFFRNPYLIHSYIQIQNRIAFILYNFIHIIT